MNGFSYENQSTITYLVYSISEDDIIDSMSLGMLTNNKIAGLAPAIYTQMNENRFIRYNVSARITAKQFLTGSVKRKRLLGILKDIVEGIISAEDYMIDTDTIILDLDYIFVDVTSCEAELICLPVTGGEHLKNDIENFLKNIMVNTQFDSTENTDYVARIFNYLNGSVVFSIEDFKKLLIELDSTVISSKTIETKATIKQDAVQTVTPITPSQSKQSATQANVNMPAYSQGVVLDNIKQNKPNQVYINKEKNTPPQTSSPSTEKQISWFYLMQHYNKENAKAYKAQKIAKKKVGKAYTVDNQVKTRQKQTVVNPNYAFPGQNGKSAFAIPGQAQTAIQTQSAVQPVANVGSQPSLQKIVPTPKLEQNTCKVPQGQVANFGDTTVLDGGEIGETTVLNVTQNPNKLAVPYLIRKKNNEKICLNKPVFRVGKERSYVDYFIVDNTAISRCHANFITRESKYFVIDTNSTNHTFVNGIMIQSNVETIISPGDTIRLANEEFEFNIN